MSVTKVPDEELLVFDHEIAANPKRVFTAYLDPSQLHRWYGPAGWRAQTDDLVVESVVGGIQRVRMVNDFDPGATCVLQSRFLAIEPYHELEYAEQLPNHLGEPSDILVYSRFRFHPETVITPEGVGEGTRITVEIGPMPPNVHEEVRTSWRSTFARLDALLTEHDDPEQEDASPKQTDDGPGQASDPR